MKSQEYRDDSPAKIVPKLADKEIYLASESTIYRILREEHLLAHRSHSKPQTHHRPEPFEAKAPNQVYTWDITYLRTVVVGMYFYLYLVLDIYSRKIVGFEVHDVEAAALSSKLVEETLEKEGIDGKEVVLHSDNGGPMKAITMLVTLQNLGVYPSFSRPGVSDDNAYPEALFKTMKYCPFFPLPLFKTLDEAREWVREFVKWYNSEHLHSGIKFVTPDQRHRGEDIKILEKRKMVYETAKLRNPQRWGKRSTRNWEPAKVVRLNGLKEFSLAA